MGGKSNGGVFPSSFLIRWGIRAGEGEEPRGGAPPCMACMLASVSQWYLAREEMARGGERQNARLFAKWIILELILVGGF